jgi:hypothetical protein
MHESRVWAGAMENWGLITFRETAVLVADTASVADRMRVAIVIAHEMAHLWFGMSCSSSVSCSVKASVSPQRCLMKGFLVWLSPGRSPRMPSCPSQFTFFVPMLYLPNPD